MIECLLLSVCTTGSRVLADIVQIGAADYPQSFDGMLLVIDASYKAVTNSMLPMKFDDFSLNNEREQKRPLYVKTFAYCDTKQNMY